MIGLPSLLFVAWLGVPAPLQGQAFREVVRDLPLHGVTFNLPSHFFPTPSTIAGEKLFLSHLGDERRVTVAAFATLDGTQHEIELYQLAPDRVVRIRVSGTEPAKKAMADELSKFRASLKKLAK